MGLGDKIAEIEAEMARTQKNKRTEHHLGALKAKLAKYRAEVSAPKTQSQKQDSFEVQKQGDARVALVGFPSVGKSTLLSTITTTFSRQAETEFTTLDCISGKLEYKGASIQMLDLPGIIDGAAANKGRGRQIISTACTADLIVMMLDHRRPGDRDILTQELASMGIRLNKERPDVSIVRTGSGIDITAVCKLTRITDETIRAILREYKIHNCQITIREDISDEDLIDVLAGQSHYVRCIYCYNKIDELSYEEFTGLVEEQGLDRSGTEGCHSIAVSCGAGWNLDGLKEEIWRRLQLTRLYTRKRGEEPDFEHPAVLRSPCSVRDLTKTIHKDFDANFKHAFVWGRSAKHMPQKVGLGHVLSDEDVVQLFTK
ncbi:uncharacterized protein PAPHI01_2114 [Pancytospora philotis]|nr:uncharacterized protein PAPHI01_2114 [Pancytospora philotis]